MLQNNFFMPKKATPTLLSNVNTEGMTKQQKKKLKKKLKK